MAVDEFWNDSDELVLSIYAINYAKVAYAHITGLSEYEFNHAKEMMEKAKCELLKRMR